LRAHIVTAAIVLCSSSAAFADERPGWRIDAYSEQELDLRAKADAEDLVRIARAGERLIADLQKNEPLFSHREDQPLTADERDLALDLFAQVISYQVALDALSRFHLEFYRIDPVVHPILHARHFLLGFAAYCAQIRLGMELIDRTIGKPQFEKLLDEGSPNRGLPKGAYALLKWNVVHVEDVGRIFAAHQYHKVLRATLYGRVEKAPKMREVRKIVDTAYEAVKGHLAKKGVELFAQNGLDLLKDGGHVAWFPVQAGVAEWMGDTRVKRIGRDLIGADQIGEAVARSQPGDIVVERRNWYLSNIGLPGFWPHAALYLGSSAEMSSFLDADEAVTKAFGGPFTRALKKKHPKAWAEYDRADHGHAHRLIEAMSEGVVFTTAEHSFAADYAAALRPRLSKLEVAKAIERAFGYFGRPYDFDFDFETDRSLVCSELVYKAYEPRAEFTGIKLDLVRVIGRPTLPPNVMIAQFDREVGKPGQQLDLAWFLDGSEKDRAARFSDLESLRASHKRPKWDIAQK
jgi:hypothetical protein